MWQGSTTELFEQFNNLKVLVVGDIMIDSYVWGKVDRISPEAPVPVVRVTAKEDRLGGAANVALNILALGATPIICAVAGHDSKGLALKALFDSSGISTAGLVFSEERPTTVKTRVISSNQHIVRVDEESLAPLSQGEEHKFIAVAAHTLREMKPDVVIFEDYNKGLLTTNVISAIIALSHEMGIPTAVDPKKENFFAYRGVSLFKPNLKELVEGLKVEIAKKDHQALESAVVKLEARLEHGISLITLSEEGIYVKRNGKSTRIPAHLRNIADVSGAGDTVISVAALCLALNTDAVFLAALSNLAGGLVCEQVGVVPVNKKLLLTEAVKMELQPANTV
jgi:rfaE bifunctional protein kinase chain/domain